MHYIDIESIHNQRISSNNLEQSHCIMYETKKKQFHMMHFTHSKQISVQAFVPTNQSFLLANNQFFYKIVQPLLCQPKVPSIIFLPLFILQSDSSSSDSSFTLTLEIPKICLLVLYMGKDKRFYKRQNLGGPCHAGDKCFPPTSLLNNSFIFHCLQQFQGHFRYLQLHLHACL